MRSIWKEKGFDESTVCEISIPAGSLSGLMILGIMLNISVSSTERFNPEHVYIEIRMTQ